MIIQNFHNINSFHASHAFFFHESMPINSYFIALQSTSFFFWQKPRTRGKDATPNFIIRFAELKQFIQKGKHQEYHSLTWTRLIPAYIERSSEANAQICLGNFVTELNRNKP